ncbi:MAG: acetyltransferase [Desulfomonilaceae bacterium]|nr:acetyltransferase [Desulfomonilaceae bacterium]
MKHIVVVGASGYAKVVADIVEKRGEFTIAGLIDSFKPKGYEVLHYQVLGNEHDLPTLVRQYDLTGGVLAIGDNWDRYRMVSSISNLVPEFEFLRLVHPSACLAHDVEIGRGTVITAGAVVNSASQVGKFCIINTRASVDHDNTVGDFASLAPGVTTGGNVTIGEFTAVSLGANIIHGITVGPHAVIGAGATVVDDVPGFSVALGTPAKVVRDRKEGERYL